MAAVIRRHGSEVDQQRGFVTALVEAASHGQIQLETKLDPALVGNPNLERPTVVRGRTRRRLVLALPTNHGAVTGSADFAVARVQLEECAADDLGRGFLKANPLRVLEKPQAVLHAPTAEQQLDSSLQRLENHRLEIYCLKVSRLGVRRLERLSSFLSRLGFNAHQSPRIATNWFSSDPPRNAGLFPNRCCPANVRRAVRKTLPVQC